MSFADKVNELLRPVADFAAGLDADPLVQAALATTLGPAGKSIVQGLVSQLEAYEAAHESDKQAAVASAVAAAQAAPAEQDTPAE